MNADDVSIPLTRDEALVLFDWLGRFNEGRPRETFTHPAEQRALFNLEAALEKLLAEPFAANYSELLSQARERLRDPAE